MKNFKKRIFYLESMVLSRPLKVICENSDTDAKKQLSDLKKQYGEFISPILLIAPNIKKSYSLR